MSPVKLGIIGTGNMGATHARLLFSNAVPGLQLTTLADSDADRLARFPQVPGFSQPEELMNSGLVEAVLIATPHYSHPEITRQALSGGLHVLVEKPLAVHMLDAQALLAAPRRADQVVAVMLNQRTDPLYAHVRELVRSGELGPVRRANWIVTDWFRSAAYYASGGWRAT